MKVHRRLSLAVVALLLLIGGVILWRSLGLPIADVSGTVTVNGRAVEGVLVTFVPKAKIRPSVGFTDAQGHYQAQFVLQKSGVAIGPCVVQFSIFRGDSMHNYLPKEFNDQAATNPKFNLDIPAQGLIFNYDIPFAGEIPPYEPAPLALQTFTSMNK
jgi:hypothetical protein